MLQTLATMPLIASTGAMLLCGHRKRQSEVGLSLPNQICGKSRKDRHGRQVIGTSDCAAGAVNCFYRTRLWSVVGREENWVDMGHGSSKWHPIARVNTVENCSDALKLLIISQHALARVCINGIGGGKCLKQPVLPSLSPVGAN